MLTVMVKAWCERQMPVVIVFVPEVV